MSTDFEKLAAPSAAMVQHEIMRESFKALAGRLMLDNQETVSDLFGQIDALMRKHQPMLSLLAAYCILDGLRRRNRKLANYGLLEEGFAAAAELFGDMTENLQ
jgi:hypothetical protein